MAKRKCPACGEMKEFRKSNKTCGCKGSNPFAQKQTQTVSTDKTWEISIPNTRIHTLDQLIKAFEIDLSIWEVKRFIANKWDMGYTVGVGSAKESDVEELYQVKAFLEKKINIVDAKREIEELKELAKTHAPQPPIAFREIVNVSGNMLEINLCDHHFGKLAWGYETGHPNYDVKIATDLFNRAFETTLQRASAYQFDEIWFIVGNDLLNSDDMQGRTTKGTVVSTDIRYTKTMAVVRNVLIACIERLRQLTPLVKVKMVSGNHDHFSVWHLGDSLECFFHNYTDVVIDNEPKYQKYDEFGNVMIMWTHGDKGKRKDFPLMMATEQPGMFGRTKFREVHTGHNHTDRVEEIRGVKVRTLSSLSPADKWHAENAYLGNLRSSEAFIYNRQHGLIGTVIYTDNDDNIDKGHAALPLSKEPQ